MHIHKYERPWFVASLAMLAAMLAIIFVSALADNLNAPSNQTQIDPTKVASTPPFDKPGLRQVGPKKYEAYYIAQIFSFTPATVTIPLGSTVTFYVTSPDVVHGFFIAHTAVNLMVVPGWVNSASHTFDTPGTYLLLCNEYCGLAHHYMFAKIEVK